MAQLKAVERYPHLDGMRGLAALAVLVHHFFQYAPPPAHHTLFFYWLRATEFGSLGVDVFFVLSGFLITLILLVDLPQPAYFHDFYWKRALRILPVYLVHLIFAALIIGHATGYILLSMFFLVNFSSLFHAPVAGVAWTLSIEEQFYLLWPQVVRRLSFASLYRIALSLVALSTFARIALSFWHGGFMRTNTVYRLDGLCLGALLACQKFSDEKPPHLVRKAIVLLNSNWTLSALILAFVTCSFTRYDALTLSLVLSLTNLLTYRLIRRLVSRNRAGWLSFLASRPLRYIGAISYAMYLFHPYVLALMERWLGQPEFASVTRISVRFGIFMVLTIAICALSRHFMELPVQRLRRYVLTSKSRSEVAVSKSLASDLGG